MTLLIENRGGVRILTMNRPEKRNALNTELTAPWNCNIDTTKFKDGTHNLMAIATDNSGLKTSTQRSFNVQNTVTQPDDPAPATH